MTFENQEEYEQVRRDPMGLANPERALKNRAVQALVAEIDRNVADFYDYKTDYVAFSRNSRETWIKVDASPHSEDVLAIIRGRLDKVTR